MLREGLRAEIPEAFDLAARLRLPAVHQMRPAVAGVAALGVRSLVTALFGTLQSAAFYTVGPIPFRQAEAITVVATAVAVVFAYGSARWRGVLAAVLLIGLLGTEQFWLSLPGRQLFCTTAGTSCDVLGFALAQLWPASLGILVGIAGRRIARPKGRGVSALAVGLGLATVVSSLGRLASVPFVGFTPVGVVAATAINWTIGAALIGAVVIGLVVGLFGQRLMTDVSLIALFYVGPWLLQLRLGRDLFPRGRAFLLELDWPLLTPPVFAVTALLAIVVGVLVRRRGSVGSTGLARQLTR